MNGISGGDDLAFGGDGDDQLKGANGADTLYGGNGSDELVGHWWNSGGDDADVLYGGSGADKLWGDVRDGSGSGGNDTLDGGSGNDSIVGGGGDDTIVAGDGTDKLWGNAGSDTFLFDLDDGTNTIYGFDDYNATQGDFDTIKFLDEDVETSDMSISTSNGDTEIAVGDTSVILDGYTDTGNLLELTYSDGSGVGVSTATVICTYMNEIGEIADDVFKWDGIYGREVLGETVIRGYHAWAIPFVGKLRNSPLLTRMVAPLARAWAQEMAHRCDPDTHDGHRLGTAILVTGVPLCRMIGSVLEALDGTRRASKA